MAACNVCRRPKMFKRWKTYNVTLIKNVCKRWIKCVWLKCLSSGEIWKQHQIVAVINICHFVFVNNFFVSVSQKEINVNIAMVLRPAFY